MKTLYKVIFCVIFISIGLSLSSQENKNHSIGIQLNPFIDEALFNGESFKFVYALRYNFQIKDHITLGPEVSGLYQDLMSDYEDLRQTGFLVNIGGYFRYSFLPKSRINPFVELSPYVSTSIPTNRPEDAYPPYTFDPWLSGYFAPGFTLINKSRRFSLDLFYKVSNEPFANGKLSVLSYRFNFKF